ncbi:hypothetical protein HYZ97_04030 [Candidatus Pacearchaeota archaeon]|nr:hypothetical protein [Candidatus Pacearchaeota archaeon]
MHQTRQEITKRLPLPRKGTKYIVRASSHRLNAVPTLIALRDMLQLARTAREVKELIRQKAVSINGKHVKDFRESIKLFNLFSAGKTYVLTLLQTGKFIFKEANTKEGRLCKVVGKTLGRKAVTQYHLHDGTNLISSSPLAIGDSVYLDVSGKVLKHKLFEKGAKAFIIKGSYIGRDGTISSHEGTEIKITFGKEVVALPRDNVVVI